MLELADCSDDLAERDWLSQPHDVLQFRWDDLWIVASEEDQGGAAALEHLGDLEPWAASAEVQVHHGLSGTTFKVIWRVLP